MWFLSPQLIILPLVIKIQVHPMKMRHVYEGCKIRLARYQSLFVFFCTTTYTDNESVYVYVQWNIALTVGVFSKTNKRVYFGVVFKHWYLSHVTFFILVNSSGTLLGEKLQFWLSNEYLVVHYYVQTVIFTFPGQHSALLVFMLMVHNELMNL